MKEIYSYYSKERFNGVIDEKFILYKSGASLFVNYEIQYTDNSFVKETIRECYVSFDDEEKFYSCISELDFSALRRLIYDYTLTHGKMITKLLNRKK